MPDLDQLLAADADADAARWPTTNGNRAALDDAFGRALHTVRHRRVRAAAVAVAAIAFAGSTATWAANRSSDRPAHHQIHLAAYDHTVGAVPGDSESIYVVGPQDEYTAKCTVVPGSRVRVSPSPSDPSRARTGAVLIERPAAAAADRGQASVSFEYPVGADWPVGPYYLFTCPTG